MNIVEQLRKYQCPENKGCNPLVEYCQCDLMDTGADEIERLREILRKIKWDIDQAQWPEELCMHWVDDVNAALQQKESE